MQTLKKTLLNSEIIGFYVMKLTLRADLGYLIEKNTNIR